MKLIHKVLSIVAINSATVVVAVLGLLPNLQGTSAAGEVYSASWDMTDCRVYTYNSSSPVQRVFLGPAGWKVEYKTISGKQMTETWSVPENGWKDSRPTGVQGSFSVLENTGDNCSRVGNSTINTGLYGADAGDPTGSNIDRSVPISSIPTKWMVKGATQ
jgi:hypothetical protein